MQATRSRAVALMGFLNLALGFLAAKVKREIGSVQLSSLSLGIGFPSFPPLRAHRKCVRHPGEGRQGCSHQPGNDHPEG